jgi:hypothetical protein
MKENNFKVGDKIQYTSTKGERKTITGTIYKIFSTVFGSCQQGTGLQVDWDNPTKTRRRTTVNAKHCVKLGQNGLGRVGRELSKSIKTIREADKHMGKALQKLKDTTVSASIAIIPVEQVEVEGEGGQFTWTTKADELKKPKIIIEPITLTFSPNLSEDRAVIAETKALCLFFDARAKKEGKMKDLPHTPKDVYKKLITYYKEHSVGYGKVRTDYFPRRGIAKEDIEHELVL